MSELNWARKHRGSIAAWVAIALTALTGAVSYGVLMQRVSAAEEAIRDTKTAGERLATAETEIRNLKQSVDSMKTEVSTLNQSVQTLVIELRLQRAGDAPPPTR